MKQNSDLRSKYTDIQEKLEQKVKERTLHLEKTRDKVSEYAVKRFEVAQELEARNRELEEKIADLGKKAEELRKEYDEKTKLHTLRKKTMRMVMHDLKNSLNIILHNSEDAADQGDALKKINQTASEMTGLVLNTLDMEKFEDTAFEVKSDHHDLVQLIHLTCRKFSDLCSLKSIELGTELPSECPVHSDHRLTSRILENLVGNACKFTPPFGKIVISATAREDMIRVEISDNGAGIRRQMLKKVFDEYASDDSNAYAYSNSDGIGLAFCKFAVEAQGGSIGIISKEGEGTRVWFTLKKGYLAEQHHNSVLSHITGKDEIITSDGSLLPENIILQLQGTDISEISTILRILRADVFKADAKLRRWKESLEAAAFSANKDLYDRLLKM